MPITRFEVMGDPASILLVLAGVNAHSTPSASSS